VNKTVQQTVNISSLTKEQLRKFLSGELTWEWAHEQAPGPEITVIEITPEEAENGDWLDDMETDDGEE